MAQERKDRLWHKEIALSPNTNQTWCKTTVFCHGVLEDEGLLLGPLKQTNDLDLQLHFFC